jgi:hypothetical protein
VRVARGGNAGANLHDPGLGGQEPHHTGQERPVGANRPDDPWKGRHHRIASRTISGVVVFAAQPVVMHPGAVRHGDVKVMPVAGGIVTALHARHRSCLAGTSARLPVDGQRREYNASCRQERGH